jgi:hypothetical protein
MPPAAANRVNCGAEMYTLRGKRFGPGVVEIDDDDTADEIRAAIARVERSKANEIRRSQGLSELPPERADRTSVNRRALAEDVNLVDPEDAAGIVEAKARAAEDLADEAERIGSRRSASKSEPAGGGRPRTRARTRVQEDAADTEDGGSGDTDPLDDLGEGDNETE